MNKKMQRVKIGIGVFHTLTRTNFSEETRKLIKILMEESKLTMMQQKPIEDAVSKGESLPILPCTPRKKKQQRNNFQNEYPTIWKRRSKETIINSGVYEREQFRRKIPLVNRDEQKKYSTCKMAYGKEGPPALNNSYFHKNKRFIQYEDNMDSFKEIIQGIRERIEFLHDMECLGVGKKYKYIIHQEITQKIRQIQLMDKEKYSEINKEIEKFIFETPGAKPFPLGELDE